eukprot:g4447.t1 g4447   contig15:1050132-1051205(+)
MPKGKTVSRVRPVPRQIRDIKPKRQLPRSEQAQDPNDDWWYQFNDNDGAESSSTATPVATHLRGASAANGARSRFGRRSTIDADAIAEGNTDVSRLKQVPQVAWERFKQTPRRKKIKRIFWGMILVFALKTIYFSDLDSYSVAEEEKLMKPKSTIHHNKKMSKSFFSDEDMAEALQFSAGRLSSKKTGESDLEKAPMIMDDFGLLNGVSSRIDNAGMSGSTFQTDSMAEPKLMNQYSDVIEGESNTMNAVIQRDTLQDKMMWGKSQSQGGIGSSNINVSQNNNVQDPIVSNEQRWGASQNTDNSGGSSNWGANSQSEMTWSDPLTKQKVESNVMGLSIVDDYIQQSPPDPMILMQET